MFSSHQTGLPLTLGMSASDPQAPALSPLQNPAWMAVNPSPANLNSADPSVAKMNILTIPTVLKLAVAESPLSVCNMEECGLYHVSSWLLP